VRYWLHNAFVIVEGEKMSKSLGNFRTIRDVLAEVGGVERGEIARLAMLMSHYRDPLDWTSDRLAQASNVLSRFYLTLNAVKFEPYQERTAMGPPASVLAALQDDLNTPLALSALHELFHRFNTEQDIVIKSKLKGEIVAGGALLGLLHHDPEAWLKGGDFATDEIDDFVVQRNAARKAKNFVLADRIRNELAIRGILLEDGPGGTTWRRAT
jgi:cysteinyl-tRNA synthetase